MSEGELVQRWLAERRHLLVELVGLSRGLRSRSAHLESLAVRMQMFCDRLVDYVSAGHFEVYADLTGTPDGARLLGRLWKQLRDTTDKVLRFNEFANRRQIDRQRMTIALAELSLALEDRFTIEDRMVRAARAEAGGVGRISAPNAVGAIAQRERAARHASALPKATPAGTARAAAHPPGDGSNVTPLRRTARTQVAATP